MLTVPVDGMTSLFEDVLVVVVEVERKAGGTSADRYTPWR